MPSFHFYLLFNLIKPFPAVLFHLKYGRNEEGRKRTGAITASWADLNCHV